MAVDMLYRDLETKNTGLCKKSNKSFPWVMEHFIIGLDEMCLMSDAHGDLRVIAAADKKKHEKFSRTAEFLSPLLELYRGRDNWSNYLSCQGGEG